MADQLQLSIEAARAMKEGAAGNDLLDRLSRDGSLKISSEELSLAADPRGYTGRASQQVDEFLAEVVEPILAGSSRLPAQEEIRV